MPRGKKGSGSKSASQESLLVGDLDETIREFEGAGGNENAAEMKTNPILSRFLGLEKSIKNRLLEERSQRERKRKK